MKNETAFSPAEEIYTVGGKINLFLKITGKKENGYHELLTFFVPISEPFDTLIFQRQFETGIQVQCNTPGIDPENNTLTKAYHLFSEITSEIPGIAIRLIKKIPHGAGLGGGSADAAVLLNWLNEKSSKRLSETELNSLAARVGADVPFFLKRESCLATGIGDTLSPMRHGFEKLYCVLLCPRIYVNTTWAYKKWDSENSDLTAAAKMSTTTLSQLRELYGVNDFEPLVFREFPDLAEIKDRLLKFDPLVCSLSGSGSSIFGIFSDEISAKKAVSFFQGNIPVYGVFQI